jgi:uncharacterized membrane protein
MRKYEVRIRGRNFLIKTGNTVRKNGFLATRFVEAEDRGAAVETVMDSLRAELKNAVLNDKTDPPAIEIGEVSELYYFKENSSAGKGFLWDERVEEEDLAVPVGALRKRWLVIQNRLGEMDLHLHGISIHFTSALYPVAILFMFLFLLFGNTSFRQTYFYMMVLATLSLPFSYLTGILEWRQKFEGARLPIFMAKIICGIAIFAIGAACTVWYALSPGVLERGGVVMAAYILLNVSILPLLVYLGYLGGKILYERLEESLRR